jgi:hypothetical protein
LAAPPVLREAETFATIKPISANVSFTFPARGSAMLLSARRTRARTLTVAVAVALPLLAAPRLAAAEPDPCPPAMPVAEVLPGLVGGGLTVERGSTPEPFSATVIGVLDDGIAPDLDMILVDADSPAIRRAGGIWAGMSGSPVYAPDGRLIGAIAYGLARGPSPIAGLTPAADILDLLDEPAGGDPPILDGPARLAGPPRQAGDFRRTHPAGARRTLDQAAARVRLGARFARLVTKADPSLSQADAQEGLAQLPVPLGVSGFAQARFTSVAGSLRSARPGAIPYRSGVAAATTVAPAAIVPGGNIAAALSYGDVTQAATGTVTAVCGDTALALGHPFKLAGATTLSAHAAEALYVQPDTLDAPFKVANPGGVVGTVDADRLAGLRARLGGAPEAIPVTAMVRAAGRSRTGVTHVNLPEALPATGALHLLANLDRILQRSGEGRSAVSWTITGTTASGEPWKLTRANRYAARADIAYESVTELLGQLTTLEANALEDVRFTGVTIEADAAEQYRQYRVGSLEAKTQAGTWEAVSDSNPVHALAGQVVNVRVTLLPWRNRGVPLTVQLGLRVPAGMGGTQGALVIDGAIETGIGPGECLADPSACADDSQAATFPALVRALEQAPRNNDVTTTMLLDGPLGTPVATKVVKPVGQIVSGEVRVPLVVADAVAQPTGHS